MIATRSLAKNPLHGPYRRRMVAVCLCVLLAQPASSRAQQSSASTAAADPAALPGDTPLPSLDYQVHKDLGPPAGTPPQKRSNTAAAGLTLELALDAANAAIAACQADGYRIGVAVTDQTGKLLVGLAADGAGSGRIYVAIRKDIAAAMFKEPTLVLREKLIANPALLAQIKPNMSVFSGAVPLMVGDRVLGAIASSGSTGNEDDKCAKAGAQKIQSKLN